ncbi:hypothetical protein [Ralstonia solanacearum]|uniref:hypothetical protein n=1 Tax=Ralstonia solanacearum TaxID=305 RepID=UPI000E592D26|nr:hypothetical protein [Ralstonia solanacearum]AXV90629.1 hypothetical protein CJO79_06270 [Ralstonia solanacearum]
MAQRPQRSQGSFSLEIPARMPLLSRRGWSALRWCRCWSASRAGVCAGGAGGHPLHLSAYALTLVGKIMCYALAALALDLVWATAAS